MSVKEGVDATHPNVALVIRGHERLEAGDQDGIDEMFDRDIVWHEFGTSSLAGTYQGKAAVSEFWKRYFAATGTNFKQDIISIMANDNYVTSIVALTGYKNGTSFEQSAVDVMSIRNGKIAEFWRYYEDLKTAEDFLAVVQE